MSAEVSLNINLRCCELSHKSRLDFATDLRKELTRFPDHSAIDLFLERLDDQSWLCSLSMKYARGHVGTTKTAATQELVMASALTEFKKNLRIHEFQSAIETFHFDKTNEYDYYTEVSNETVSGLQRNLATLVVEDDPAASAVLKATLKALGCAVDLFALPSAALEALASKRYDLLVLDWNLPYMNGGEFLIAADKLLQQNDIESKPIRHVPVVICTSLPLAEIVLPPVKHFFFFNHWHKSLPFSSILGSFDETTKRISIRNQIHV